METKTLPSETEAVAVAQPAPASPDLSADIALTVERLPGDRVRAVRVWGNHYRCNWIAPRNRIDPLETLFVRQSRFLHVTRNPDGTLAVRVVNGAN